MAVKTNDSLYNVSQIFLSPDILQKISHEINQPIEQTKKAIKAVIPTLLMGIVNKGTTKEGAESLVTMASTHNAVPDISLNPVDIKEGSEFVRGVFGGNFESTVSKLGRATGMNTMSINRILGMSAPMIMGAIGTKIKSEKMSVTNVMNFLNQQKSSLIGLIPTGILGIQNKDMKKVEWPKVVLVGVVLAGALWWFNATFSSKVAELTTAPTQIMDTSKIPAEPMRAFEDFMNSNPTAGTVKRFRMEKAAFKTGTVVLNGAAAEIELNRIASVLKAYPETMVRVEGFTDNIGSSSNNQIISNKRALAIKSGLVNRGVKANRIETLGRGASEPVATNRTDKGRAANRRIELIIKR